MHAQGEQYSSMLFGFPLEDYSATHTASNTENKTQPHERSTGTAL